MLRIEEMKRSVVSHEKRGLDLRLNTGVQISPLVRQSAGSNVHSPVKRSAQGCGMKAIQLWWVQVFDVPRGRKGLIGGVCVGLVAIVGFVVLVRSGGRAAAGKRAARRRREEAAR